MNVYPNWLVSTKNVRTHVTLTLVEGMLDATLGIIDQFVSVLKDSLEILKLSAKSVSQIVFQNYFYIFGVFL